MNENQAIPRPLYDERLQKSLGSSHVKVLTGVRRCGKSTLLAMLVERIAQEGCPPNNIFYRRFDQFGMPINPDAEWLLSELSLAMERHTLHFRSMSSLMKCRRSMVGRKRFVSSIRRRG